MPCSACGCCCLTGTTARTRLSGAGRVRRPPARRPLVAVMPSRSSRRRCVCVVFILGEGVGAARHRPASGRRSIFLSPGGSRVLRPTCLLCAMGPPCTAVGAQQGSSPGTAAVPLTLLPTAALCLLLPRWLAHACTCTPRHTGVRPRAPAEGLWLLPVQGRAAAAAVHALRPQLLQGLPGQALCRGRGGTGPRQQGARRGQASPLPARAQGGRRGRWFGGGSTALWASAVWSCRRRLGASCSCGCGSPSVRSPYTQALCAQHAVISGCV